MDCRDLAVNLRAAGKDPEEIVEPHGARLLVLPHGGRLIGAYAKGSSKNFLWTNQALGARDTARAFFQTRDWHNSGGDRTWLGPEVDVCFPRYPNLNIWQVPSDIDPGDYRAKRQGQAVELITPFEVTAARSGKRVQGKITKRYEPAANPLRYESPAPEFEATAYAGFRQETVLELCDGPRSPSVGLWNLLALPYGGEALIPTYCRALPRVYSGSIRRSELVVTEHLVRFRPRQRGVQKIAIRAVNCTGRLGYLYRTAGDWALVVRNFTVDPSGDYLDVPWHESEAADELVYCAQICAVNSELGSYCELEYHAPGIGGKSGRCSCRDLTQVWAFRGREESMRMLARRLLSPELSGRRVA